jgi:hypothetical protein
MVPMRRTADGDTAGSSEPAPIRSPKIDNRL